MTSVSLIVIVPFYFSNSWLQNGEEDTCNALFLSPPLSLFLSLSRSLFLSLSRSLSHSLSLSISLALPLALLRFRGHVWNHLGSQKTGQNDEERIHAM